MSFANSANPRPLQPMRLIRNLLGRNPRAMLARIRPRKIVIYRQFLSIFFPSILLMVNCYSSNSGSSQRPSQDVASTSPSIYLVRLTDGVVSCGFVGLPTERL